MDLGRALVANGWALPLQNRASEYELELAEARREKRGLWNGDWQIKAREAR
jgi:endonuclease YncB( thermonuclease family)